MSDIAVLRRLLTGARIRGVRNLHAKVYLFGSKRAVITSANLTVAALDQNYEFGLVSADPKFVADCISYFDRLWSHCGPDPSPAQIADWENVVARHRALGGRANRPAGLDDFGADVGIVEPPSTSLPTVVADASQAFVKFFGRGSNRAPLSQPTLDEIKGSGCHWALSYPAAKRPAGVKDDAIMFISRLD